MQFRSQLLRRNTHQTLLSLKSFAEDYGYSSSLIPITWNMWLRGPWSASQCLVILRSANPSGYVDVSCLNVSECPSLGPSLGHSSLVLAAEEAPCQMSFDQQDEELIAAIRVLDTINMLALSSQITWWHRTLYVHWPLVTTTQPPLLITLITRVFFHDLSPLFLCCYQISPLPQASISEWPSALIINHTKHLPWLLTDPVSCDSISVYNTPNFLP